MRGIRSFVGMLVVCLVALTAARVEAQAFNLTPAQKAALAADVQADQAAKALYDGGDMGALATYYNQDASPDFWVWRTAVAESDYTGLVSPDGTTWSWTTYINRSQAERDGWARLFASSYGYTNPSQLNVRQGVADIFSGAGGAAQRTHLLAMSRRKATRFEKVFATGTGSTLSPATLVLEGNVDYLVFTSLP